jgi:hypothetical protein
VKPAPRTQAQKPIVVQHNNPEGVQNERELEELQNLKKELQELKALKNSANYLEEGGEDSTEEIDPNFNPNENPNPYGAPAPSNYKPGR